MRLHNSKKGDVTDFLADFLPYLLFVLIILAFFLIFEIKGNSIENALRVKLEDVSGGYEAVDFLRSPVSINVGGSDRAVDMADLITYNYPSLDYEEEIEKNITLFFNHWKGKGWHLTIKYPNGKKKDYGHDKAKAFIKKASQAMLLAAISSGRIITIPVSKASEIHEYLPLPNGELIEIKYSHWVIVLA